VDLSVNLNKFKLAQTLHREMQSRNLQADQYTYSTLIKGMKKQIRWVPRDEAYIQIFGWLAELTSHMLEIDCVL